MEPAPEHIETRLERIEFWAQHNDADLGNPDVRWLCEVIRQFQREKQELVEECAKHVATIERMNQINRRIAAQAIS